MTTPLEDLRHEHRLIERALAVLERANELLGSGQSVPVTSLEQALSFVRGFADGCHHAKEEHGLFPILAAKNPTIEAGPVKVLSADHEAGRKLMRDLELGLGEMRANQPYGRDAVCKALATYTHMLRRHIAKEEDILFPLSEGLLTDDDAAQLAVQFRQVEQEAGQGAHERYEAIVGELEVALGVQPEVTTPGLS